MEKFNYINHSIPLSRRKKNFKTYEEMMKCIDDDRSVEELHMTDFINLSYDNTTHVFCLEAEIEEYENVKNDYEFDCPRYAIAQLCRDILNIGDITPFIKSTQGIDKSINERERNEITGEIVLSTENMDYLNRILQDTWHVKRTQNRRTADVNILRVFDFATASKDGDGRAIVTGKYIHKPDWEVMDLVKKKAEEVNENIEFVKGYATALMTRGSFVDTTPQTVNDKEVLLGVSVVNSEFKYSGLHLIGYLYIPEYDIELIGKTARLSVALKHVGDKTRFENLMKKGVETVLGLDNEIIELFSNVTTCESRGVAIDFTAYNEKGSNALGVELGMTSKIKDLLKIKEERGFPSTIEGVALTLMDYSTHHAESESERDRVNQAIMRVLQRPDSFVQSLGERISRADVIDIVEEDPMDNGIIRWI